MLYFLVVWTGLLGVCLMIGCGWLHLLKADAIARPTERFILSAWLGLSTLAILLLAAALFVPVSPWVGLGLSLSAMLPALGSAAARVELASWWQQSLARWRLAGYGLIGITIAAFMSQEVDWIDTGAYHYGLIHWFGKYGVTPGLVLLNRQFGFVSAWFALAAPFNPPSHFIGIDGRASNVMNGFALLLAVVQMAIASRCILQSSTPANRNQLSNWFLLLFTLTVCCFLTQTPLLSRITASASPDIAIALFSVAVPWSMLVINRANPSPKSASSLSIIPVVLAAAAFSIKLTALPLLPIALGFYLFRSFTLVHWAKGCLLTLVLILPLLATQTIISGYPLYPSTLFRFDLPWTRAILDVQDLAADTHGWAQWFGQPPADANRYIWFITQWLGSTHTSKLIGGLILLSLGASFYLLSSFKTRNNYGFLWLQLLSAIGITFMMLKAPLFRLGMGYPLLLPILSAALICNFICNRAFQDHKAAVRLAEIFKKTNRKKKNRYLAIASLGAVVVVTTQLNSTTYRHILFAPSLPVPSLRQQQINGITYTITQDDKKQCWSADLPCVADLPLSIQLRNPSVGIEGGFVYGDFLAK